MKHTGNQKIDGLYNSRSIFLNQRWKRLLQYQNKDIKKGYTGQRISLFPSLYEYKGGMGESFMIKQKGFCLFQLTII